MKKLLLCLMVFLSLACTALAGAAYDGVENLPAAIADYLASSERWSSYTVSGWANPAGQQDGFVALHKKGDNELLCFRLTDGAWQYVWHNDGALPDNDQPFILEDATGSADIHTERVYDKPYLWSYYVLNDELCDFSCGWEKQSDGSWLLTHYTMFEPTDFSVHVNPKGLEFYLSDTQKYPDVAEGVIERSLRYIDAETLPMSLAEAEKKLSNPPEIPQGKLEAERIKFTGSKRYKVYQGPGEIFGQAGNGKAVVSTNDWIQVFGRDGDWIMIQYDITSERMRIGWISADALPKGAQVPELAFFNQQATVTVDGACVTDDPLFSQITIALLPKGSTVSQLSTMGEWSYIQVYSATPMYGFIKTSMLQLETIQQRAQRQGSNSLTEVYGYSQEEVDARFVFSGSITGNEFIITMYPADRPSWVYEAVFRVDTGKHIRSFTPFATDYEGYIGEGTFRYTLDTAITSGWLYNWLPEDRAALKEWMLRWEMPMTDKLAQGLDTGNITCSEAVTELFLSCYGPNEHWPQALREWHADMLKIVEENYPANG